MDTISGIPAHALLVHGIVVLAPLTSLLVILCAFWPAARRRLVWLVVVFAVVTTVLTPLTTSAGEWLLEHGGPPRPILQEHAERGEWMIYFSVAMLIVAVALAALHWMEGRSDKPRKAVAATLAVVALLVGVSSIITVVRIGDTGALAVWGDRG
ncbi:MAG: hypothetical protein K2X52_31265 [Mycobacteriaceae bacterium]|nr:hypothetical protein [Mycobacteriaceae bacterium]